MLPSPSKSCWPLPPQPRSQPFHWERYFNTSIFIKIMPIPMSIHGVWIFQILLNQFNSFIKLQYLGRQGIPHILTCVLILLSYFHWDHIFDIFQKGMNNSSSHHVNFTNYSFCLQGFLRELYQKSSPWRCSLIRPTPLSSITHSSSNL